MVIIAGAEEGITSALRTDPDPEEERRLIYVALTCPRQQLYITPSEKRILYGQEKTADLSRYVREIPAAYTEQFIENPPRKKTMHAEQLHLF